MRLWRRVMKPNNSVIESTVTDDTSSQAVLHIFRALLRQCTYLPDPAARLYMHRHIVSRFRDYHPSSTVPYSSRRFKSTALVQQRLPSLLRTARKGLVTLRRANEGYMLHLGRILAMTYGRIGKRRHQLLFDLKVSDVPADQAAVARLLEPANQDVPHPSERFMTLVKAQSSRRVSPFFSRSKALRLKPDIAEKNIWGRPMPIKRVRNMKRRWYAETLDRIAPPLAEEEWDGLRMRASGQLPWEGPVARRKWAGRLEDNGQSRTVGERHDISLQGTGKNPHKITARYMRRLWGKVAAECPVMKPNAAKKFGWEVSWGDAHRYDSKNFVLGIKGKAGIDMFGGVDENGKVVAQGK